MQMKGMHALPEGGAHMHGAMLCGGHGLKRAWAPARQLAALRGLVPQLRVLLNGLQGSRPQHSAWGRAMDTLEHQVLLHMVANIFMACLTSHRMQEEAVAYFVS